MNEHEWFACQDPAEMLREIDTAQWAKCFQLSDRNLRLWVAAMCDVSACDYSAFSYLDRWRDGLAYKGESKGSLQEEAELWCGTEYDSVGDPPLMTRADLLRDIIGNPFRPVTLPQQCVDPDWSPTQWSCSWLTPQAFSLAQAAYDFRDWDSLPILADALEEAGCDAPCLFCDGKGKHQTGMVRCDLEGIHDTREEFICVACQGSGRGPHPVVAHLRSPGPHVRGCWAVDLLRNKE